MGNREEHGLAEPAYVVLVRGAEERVVYDGGLKDCEAWLALNGDKPSIEEGHFELREGIPPAEPTTGR